MPLQIVSTTHAGERHRHVNNQGTTNPSDDKIVYTPKAGFAGTDTFSYSISDGKGGSDTATVSVAVQSPDTIAFTTVSLTGIPNKSYTSLQFGPDGRLYASDRFGEIFAFKVQEQVDSSGKVTGYAATSVQTINLIKSIPNHNDDGTLNTAITNRQVTGIVVDGHGGEPRYLRRLERSARRGRKRRWLRGYRARHELGHHLAADMDRQRLAEGRSRARPAPLGREPLDERAHADHGSRHRAQDSARRPRADTPTPARHRPTSPTARNTRSLRQSWRWI